ncbi:lysine exporter LysO family protein [Pseudaeromonas sharmana]|uniref:Lysine exporter LysO family protein n=1 Tax=Pseudaeromonas sharmana TaxID=328412 RepID=A0ABV8CS66_9GAMM
MLLDVILILFPLICGYLIPLHSPQWLKRLQWLCSQMVYLILFLMGIGLAFVDQLDQQLWPLFRSAGLLTLCICSANLLALWWLDRRQQQQRPEAPLAQQSMWRMAWESLRMALVVVAGTALGLLLEKNSLPVHEWSNWALMLLLLLIGIQMRNSGMSLRQMLLNLWAVKIAALLIVSSWLGGLIAGWLLGWSWQQSLALSSAFGWYSLSGILVSGELGPLIGSTAFLNDLFRELLALMAIPLLMRRHPSAAIGLGGATALDFTLPIIQRSGGLAMVPIAVVSGFILSLLGPLLMLFFLSLT